MTAIANMFAVLFGIVFEALVRFVKAVFLYTALFISLFVGAILIAIQLLR